MAGLTVKTANGKTAYAVGDPVSLVAEAPAGATSFRWKHDGKPVGGTENAYSFDMAADSGGEYALEAKAADGSALSGSITLTTASATGATDAEPQPVYHGSFANRLAAVLAVLGLVLAAFIGPWRHGGMSDADWTALGGQLKVAVVLGLPATLFGSLVLLAGLWMAIVEWRGRQLDEDKATPKLSPARAHKGAVTGEDVAKVIAAVGSLRGAALAMTIGAILLLGAAWVAQSAAGAGSAEPTPSAAPSVDTPAPSDSAAPASS
jgi:hypothetical protein